MIWKNLIVLGLTAGIIMTNFLSVEAANMENNENEITKPVAKKIVQTAGHDVLGDFAPDFAAAPAAALPAAPVPSAPAVRVPPGHRLYRVAISLGGDGAARQPDPCISRQRKGHGAQRAAGGS